MSFVVNGVQYILQRLLSSGGGGGNVQLVVDSNGLQYVAKYSRNFCDEQLEDMRNENQPGPFTSCESMLREIQVYEIIKQHYLGDWPPTLLCYYGHAVFKNTDLPANMQNSFNEDVVVMILEYVPESPDVHEWMNLAQDMFSAVLTLKSMGIRHEDISLNNVLYNSLSGRYMLIDLGEVLLSGEQGRPLGEFQNLIAPMVYTVYTGQEYYNYTRRNPNEKDKVIRWVNETYEMPYKESLDLLVKMFPEEDITIIIGLTIHRYSEDQSSITEPITFTGLRLTYPEAYRITQYFVAVNPEFAEASKNSFTNGLADAYEGNGLLTKILRLAYRIHIDVYNRVHFFLAFDKPEKDYTTLVNQLNSMLDLHIPFVLSHIQKMAQ